jgi:hypothetical protein
MYLSNQSKRESIIENPPLHSFQHNVEADRSNKTQPPFHPIYNVLLFF